jgi:hypothetical protein
MGAMMERDAGDWLRRPMRRHRAGVDFDLGRGYVGGIRVAGMPTVHEWDGSGWVLPDYCPKVAHDGSVVFRPRQGIRWTGDVFHGLDGRSVTLRSAGVLDKGTYRPLWKAGPLYASPFLLRQSVGPFEHQVHVLEESLRSEIHIREMPNLPGGDALAFEFCADRMLPPDKCPCHPWYMDAKGKRADVAKMRWLGGRYEYVPLADLERLTFPVIIDPETNNVTFRCSGTGQSATVYLDARNLVGTGIWFCLGSGALQALGQTYTFPDEPTFYGVWRAYNGWEAGAACGLIITADVKVACSYVSPSFDEDIYFKHFDGAGRSCANAAECKQMYLDTDTTGTTIVGTFDELRAVGCVLGTYGPYHALNAVDIAHLNDFYGLGNTLGYPLYFGLQAKNDYDATPPASIPEFCSLRSASYLRYVAESCGGFIWLIGG